MSAASMTRVITGVHPPVSAPDVPVRRPRRRRITAEEKRALGSTRWASPPPSTSWRAYAVCLLCGDVGLILIAWGMGWI